MLLNLINLFLSLNFRTIRPRHLVNDSSVRQNLYGTYQKLEEEEEKSEQIQMQNYPVGKELSY